MNRERYNMNNPLADQLRGAIWRSGASQAKVARTCLIAPSVLSRFMTEQAGLSFSAAGRLMYCLYLKLVPENEWAEREAVWQRFKSGDLVPKTRVSDSADAQAPVSEKKS